MHGLMSYRRFGKARSLRRDRTACMCGSCVMTELGSSVFRSSYSDLSVTGLDFQCHKFEVNQHPSAEVIHVLLKSGQSASREEAVEEMKDYRSMLKHWCRSTWMPECGPNIFYDRLKPRSNHKLPECP
ncbi:hypothetical protein F2Q70_00035716 [Brassica cretica]|uniref:Uncharacterized protein n=1 Tax=Brassica cretica TaxID=69181 RepID=A0A8S9JZE8_BRACR|nr:hypothetical protein F2Q70_00035716 [Brassica cretica]